jgi:DNA-binding LacI/PurR family transcriptional regulator
MAILTHTSARKDISARAIDRNQMSPGLFSYNTLAAQVADRITEAIRRGTWVAVLPNERMLAQTLQISRKTLRKALAMLKRAGLVEASARLGHRIVARSAPKKRMDIAVGLLTPEPLDCLPTPTALWVDELRLLLSGRGIRLASYSSSRFFGRHSASSLARLTRQNPMACCVLTHSDASMQRWFSSEGVPCILAGSCQRGLKLPSVDLDYFAVCRHAVGAMLRLGHRRLVFLSQESPRVGDLESEAGFCDGAAHSGHADVTATINRHDGSVEGLWRTMTRLFSLRSPPTGILIAKPIFYLTTMSFLAHRGLRVGVDVSLMSRDHDYFLRYLRPSPAGYAVTPRAFAKRMYPVVLARALNQPLSQLDYRIEPKIVRGESLAAPPPVH